MQWHAYPGELSTRPGFRVMELHQLYFDSIAPFWEEARVNPKKQLQQHTIIWRWKSKNRIDKKSESTLRKALARDMLSLSKCQDTLCHRHLASTLEAPNDALLGDIKISTLDKYEILGLFVDIENVYHLKDKCEKAKRKSGFIGKLFQTNGSVVPENKRHKGPVKDWAEIDSDSRVGW